MYVQVLKINYMHMDYKMDGSCQLLVQYRQISVRISYTLHNNITFT
jgi:hypothetical protein